MAIESFRFPGSTGAMLAARLDRPVDEPRAYALFAHCFACGKDILAASRIARALTDHGIAVLRFDFTGLGHSDGEFANTGFASNIEDLKAAAAHMREALKAPSLLIGHSLGGAAVLAAAGDIPEARAVATIGAPFDPSDVARHFAAQREDIERHGEAWVSLAGRSFRVGRGFLDVMDVERQRERIASLGRALLIFHAPRDEVVGIENASRIFQAAKHPKSFVSLDDADHLLSRREDAGYVADVLAAWSARYLDAAEARSEALSPKERAADGAVRVSETGAGKFQQLVEIGAHRLIADEPQNMGGMDSGAGPYDLLLAALGACTSMTLRMYADHKKWPLAHVTVILDHDKIHAEDCRDCATMEGKLDRISRRLVLAGDLDPVQRARLVEIADKCPVHRTLQSEIVIETDLER